MQSKKFKNLVVVLFMVLQLLVPIAFGQSTAGVQLEGAIAKEQVDGDLKSAIAAYQNIAKDSSAPREVRAKALLHLAGCYEKLGQQAQNVYQQIVRDFADQPAATQARVRLAALKQNDRPAAPATMTQRKVVVPGFNPGPGDTDGHRAVFFNKATGELIYGDLAGKSKRVIFRQKTDPISGFAPSRDFSIVALVLGKPDQQHKFAVVNIDGTGYRELAKLDSHTNVSEYWSSWDNRYYLCVRSQEGTSHLLRISIADGQIRELLTTKTRLSDATFSPNGRFVAYEVPSSAGDPISRIFVLPAEGGEPQNVYEERRIAGFSLYFQGFRLFDWTADGRYLAIASERTGKGALYLLPIKDGKSAGNPVLVKNGDFEGGVTTATGGLIYGSVKPGGLWAVYLASLDLNDRVGDWKRLELPLGNTLNPFPRWSSDSKQIVYVASNQDAGQSSGEVVHLHELSTGEDRELYQAHGLVNCSLADHEPKLFCIDRTAEENDLISVSVDSREVERLHTFPSSWIFVDRPSRDDRSLYLLRHPNDQAGGGEILRWEIAKQRETVVGQLAPTASFGLVSSDERWLVQLNREKQVLEICPLSGATWESLVSKVQSTGHFATTPDGNWLLYHYVDSEGKHSLFRVAMAGRQPELLGDFPSNSWSGTMEVSPDGSKIMVAAGEYQTGYELWSLENFVPPAPKR